MSLGGGLVDQRRNQKPNHKYLSLLAILIIIAVVVIIYMNVMKSFDAKTELTTDKSTTMEESNNNAFLLAYFRSGINQTDMKRFLHYAYSRDGLHWYELNNNNGVWAKNLIVRDPFLNKGPDGKWHLVFTTGNPSAIGYAESEDLINWSDGENIPVMKNYKNVVNAWAPEWTYDSSAGVYRIYWASTLDSVKADNNKQYTCTTTDWKTFSDATLLFDPGYSVIDAHIAPYDGRFYMFYKDESLLFDNDPVTNGSAIRTASAAKLEGPYMDISTDWVTPINTEGSTVLKLPNSDKWYHMYDYWSQGKFGIKESTNIKDKDGWSRELTPSSYRFPFQVRHCSAAYLTEKELWRIIERYSLQASYKFDSKTETTIIDSSVNKNNGDTQNGVTWIEEGKLGGAIKFKGDNSYVLLTGNNSKPKFMQDAFKLRSISMWVKADKTKGTQILYDEGGGEAGFAIKIENGQLKAAVTENNKKAEVATTFSDTKSWHHVAVVFNEGNLDLYMDGQCIQSVTAEFKSVSLHNSSGGIGKRFESDAFGETGDGAYFKGKLDEVQIYTIPLQNKDIQILFKR
jgi:hypothetical protein